MSVPYTLSEIAQQHIARTGFSEFDMTGPMFSWLDEQNPEDAVTQLDRAYGHGGGWKDFEGFGHETGKLTYPGDPAMRMIATAQLRDETIELFESAWVCVTQSDGSFRVARMD